MMSDAGVFPNPTLPAPRGPPAEFVSLKEREREEGDQRERASARASGRERQRECVRVLGTACRMQGVRIREQGF